MRKQICLIVTTSILLLAAVYTKVSYSSDLTKVPENYKYEDAVKSGDVIDLSS